MTMTDDEIARLRELLAKATPGPWVYSDMMPNTYGPAFVDGPDTQCLAICGDGVRRSETHGFCLKMHDGESEANAALIVALRNNADALLAERAALKGQVEAMREALEIVTDMLEATALQMLAWQIEPVVNFVKGVELARSALAADGAKGV